MRQVTRKGLMTMAAAGGVLALSGGYAHADAGAAGDVSNSPGVLSGNSVEIPVDVPVNVCGNSVSVVGLLDPAAGNACGISSGNSASAGRHGSGAQASGAQASGRHAAAGRDMGNLTREYRAGMGKHRAGGNESFSGATAEGYANGSAGFLSGNTIQVPVDVPVNACGGSVTIGGLLSHATGNTCENDADVSTPPVDVPVTPVTPLTPLTPEKPEVPGPRGVPNAPEPQLAHTGAGVLDLLVPAGAGLLLAGAGTVLYRRSRMAA
ncbi:chaplin [Streptomyces sp. NBC_00873]|uniref:chaplin n=1 Tax=unclassified Streptomyces TaxID=2593676 RepID=UPI0038640814|nr:chaplin [Streptomyces sp. NBC_00873]WTA42934.1 chaplin [Streptomyces sp. NBC_00842]